MATFANIRNNGIVEKWLLKSGLEPYITGFKPLFLNYEPKKCHFCQSSDIRKHGIRNNIQRYKCNICNKIFTLKKKLNPINIWNDYSIGKQTSKQLAAKYHCSIRTIQRYLEKAPNTALNPPLSRYLNIIADTTFFGREFSILVIMDSLSKKMVNHRGIKTEKDVYYRIPFNSLRIKSYKIQSITYDGKQGILKDLLNTPTQMCHFHMVAIVMRVLKSVNLYNCIS